MPALTPFEYLALGRNAFVAFDYRFQYDATIIALILTSFAAICNSVIFLATLRQVLRRQSNVTPTEKIVGVICLCHSIFATSSFIRAIHLIKDQGWSVASLDRCATEATVEVAVVVSILFLTLLLAIERYYCIVLQKQLQHRTVHFAIPLLILLACLITTSPHYTGLYLHCIALRPSMILCAGGWYSEKGRAFPILAILCIMIPVSVVNHLYMKILQKVSATSKEARQYSSKSRNSSASKSVTSHNDTTSHSHPTSSTPTKLSILEAVEKRVLFLSLTITGTFLLAWTPTLIMIFYEAITVQPASAAFDTVSVIAAFLHSALDPIIILGFNSRARMYVRDLVFFRK